MGIYVNMRTVISFLIALFFVATLNITTSFAQDFPQWGLPEGAIARLGKGTISEIAYSPDGSRLAVGGSIGIWIYDADTGAEVALIGGYTGGVNSVSFSPDGNTIVSGGQHQAVRFWDAATGNLINTLEHGRRNTHVLSVAYSPDGNTIASGGSDGIARLWDAATGNLRNTFVHGREVNSVAFSPDGTTIASGGTDSTVQLWDTATGNRINTLTGHEGYVFSVAFSPDSNMIVSGSQDNTVRLWDTATGNLINTLTERGGYVHSVAFSPDGTTIASGRARGTVHLLDAATGNLIHTLTGPTRTYEVLSVAYSPDGTTLAGGSGHPGSIIAGGSIDSYTVRLWDADTGNLINTLTGHTGWVLSVAYSPDGNTLASGSWQGKELRLWDTANTSNLMNTLTKDGGHQILSVAYSPDGTTLAGGSGGDVHLWDANTGNPINIFRNAGSYSVAYSPDGTTIASSAFDVQLWDVATGNRINTLTEHTGRVRSVAFSPDGTTIASGSWDDTVRLWDTATGNLIKTLEHRSTVESVAFSPDGTTLASGGRDGLHLWDTATGNHINTLRTSFVNSVAYSPDGTTIASASGGYVSLWDAATGNRIKTLMGHIDAVNSIAYSPDGTVIASGSHDSTVLLWRLAPTSTPAPITFTPAEIADQTFVANTPIEPLPLPVASGGTPPYTYTLEPLPNGLVFDPAAQVLSGTPTTPGATPLTYTATDTTGTSASLTFTIEVIGDVPGADPLDVNGDGQVNVVDLAIVALFYGTRVHAGVSLLADVNADGVVNILDLTAVAQGIDDAGGGLNQLSLWEVEAALLAAAEQAAEIGVVARAPGARWHGRGSTASVSVRFASKNVADALSDVKHLTTGRRASRKGVDSAFGAAASAHRDDNDPRNNGTVGELSEPVQS